MTGAKLYSNAIENRANATNLKTAMKLEKDMKYYKILENTENAVNNVFNMVSTYKNAFSAYDQKKQTQIAQQQLAQQSEADAAAKNLETLRKAQDTHDQANGELYLDQQKTRMEVLRRASINDGSMSLNAETGDITFSQGMQDLVKETSDWISNSSFSDATKFALAKKLSGIVEDEKRSSISSFFEKASGDGFSALQSLAQNTSKNVAQHYVTANTQYVPSGQTVIKEYSDLPIESFDYDPSREGIQSFSNYIASLVKDNGLTENGAMRIATGMRSTIATELDNAYRQDAVNNGKLGDYKKWLDASGYFSTYEKNDKWSKALSEEATLKSNCKTRGGNIFETMSTQSKGVDSMGKPIGYSVGEMRAVLDAEASKVENRTARQAMYNGFSEKQESWAKTKVTETVNKIRPTDTARDIQACLDSYGCISTYDGDGNVVGMTAGDNADVLFGLDETTRTNLLAPLQAKADARQAEQDKVNAEMAALALEERQKQEKLALEEQQKQEKMALEKQQKQEKNRQTAQVEAIDSMIGANKYTIDTVNALEVKTLADVQKSNQAILDNLNLEQAKEIGAVLGTDFGEGEEGDEARQKALDSANDVFLSKEETALRKATDELAKQYKAEGRAAEAASLYDVFINSQMEKTLGVLSDTYGEDTPEYADMAEKVGSLYAGMKQEARAQFEKWAEDDRKKALDASYVRVQKNMDAIKSDVVHGALTPYQAVEKLHESIAREYNVDMGKFSAVWDSNLSDGVMSVDGRPSVSAYIRDVAPNAWATFNNQFVDYSEYIASDYKGIYDGAKQSLQDTIAQTYKKGWFRHYKGYEDASPEVKAQTDALLNGLYADFIELSVNGTVDSMTGQKRVATASDYQDLVKDFKAKEVRRLMDFSQRNGTVRGTTDQWVSPIKRGWFSAPEEEQALAALGEFSTTLDDAMWLEKDSPVSAPSWHYADPSIKFMTQSVWSAMKDSVWKSVEANVGGMELVGGDVPDWAKVDGRILPVYTFRDKEGFTYRYVVMDDGYKGGSIYPYSSRDYGDLMMGTGTVNYNGRVGSAYGTKAGDDATDMGLGYIGINKRQVR